MRHIDRLYMKALRLRPQYDGVCIISNASGTWKIDDKEFLTLEEAEHAVCAGCSGGENGLLIIINDAGPGCASEGRKVKNGRGKIKNKNCRGSAPDTHKSNKHGSEWQDRHEEREYNHSWV